MTVRYLLDTNVLSLMIRDPRGVIAQRIASAGDGNVFTSVVVACELRFDAHKRGSTALIERIEELLDSIAVASLDAGVDRHYAEIRLSLESRGIPIGANDMLIAAHAREREAVLVSDNADEFRRVPGLRVENWSRVQ